MASGGARTAIRVPRFDIDPFAWFAWADERMAAGETVRLARQRPSAWESAPGRRWRLVRTDLGVEARPDLVAPFLRPSDGPMISALAMDSKLIVELTATDGRWIGEFSPGELDLAALGAWMLRERHLPHDNLRLLFPRKGR